MILRSSASTRVIFAAAGLVSLALVTWLLAPLFVLNLGALFLRDLALDPPSERITAAAPAETRVPWVVRAMPLVRTNARASVDGIWLVARTARMLEYRGLSSRGIGCAWNPPACADSVAGIRLSAAGHAALARAYADGRLSAGTLMDAEIIAWSCAIHAAQSGDSSTAARCRTRLAGEFRDVAVVLSEAGVVVGEFVDELSDASGARLGAALASHHIDCGGGLSFLRRWIRRDGFQPGQLAASSSLASACPDLAEAQFYVARAADVSGRPEETGAAYARSEPARHPEAAFWHADFLARHGQPIVPGPVAGSMPADGQQFDAAALLARFEDGTPMLADTLITDVDVAHTKARRGSAFGTVLAHGPYLRLPAGRYRVSFFVKAAGATPSARIARLDVREDSDSWRPYLAQRVLLGRDFTGSGYERFDQEFTSTGEGTFSTAVVTLTSAQVFFARVELTRIR